MAGIRALKKLSVKRLRALLEQKVRAEKAAPLLRKRERLARRLAKLDRKIRKLQGRKVRGPGRPRKRRFTADARRRMAAAAKRRWAKVKAAQRSKAPAPATV
jgi:hypothetical protein